MKSIVCAVFVLFAASAVAAENSGEFDNKAAERFAKLALTINSLNLLRCYQGVVESALPCLLSDVPVLSNERAAAFYRNGKRPRVWPVMIPGSGRLFRSGRTSVWESIEHFCGIFGLLVRTRHKQQFTSGRESSTSFIARSDMSALLKQISQWLCPHRFSWPHSGIHGQDYQVCLRCGTAFEYDTTAMRRTGRVFLPTGAMSRQ